MIESRNTILLLSGSEYAEAATAMMLITPSIILVGASNITGIQILVPLGYEKYTVISTFGGALADLVLNALLIPHYGAAGAALATLITEAIVLLIQLFFMKKKNLTAYLSIDWKNMLKIAGSCLAATLFVLLIRSFVHLNGLFAPLAISAIAFFGLYLGLLAISREYIFRQYGMVYVGRIVKKLIRKE